MNYHHTLAVIALAATGLSGCATTSDQSGTLAELQQVQPDVKDIYLEDSLERAAHSYRRYLEETTESARTPEAMRRLADLQIEQAYGVFGKGEIVEMAAPETTGATQSIVVDKTASLRSEPTESEREFEQRATGRDELLSATVEPDTEFFGDQGEPVPAGPREAIKTYRKILETYPNYERNDKVLYQMSRAYDEIGQPDEAMEVMDRLVTEYPYSKYVDEVQFRRGEYFFIRKKFMDAEDAYGSIISMGSTSTYYELARYKLGWTLYKQELYKEALHNYVALLDYRNSTGYNFDQDFEENDEHRIADTFRVISLSFSNLGGPEVLDEYFETNGHRSYADKIYGNLGEFYFDKLRYEDATSVYKSFTDLNPLHKVSPHFGMRVIEIYGEAGFPMLVVESKRDFATRYALAADYWHHFDVENNPEVIAFLKTNLGDLAGHYHALYQDDILSDDKVINFSEAERWYRQLLVSFPADPETPQVNYRLADLLLENENFDEAAAEYERTAYEYAEHEKASAAGYAAVYAYRQSLAVATGVRQREVKQLTVASSLRFADTFASHEQAPIVLGAAADDLYEMKDFPLAIDSARKLIARYPGTEDDLLRSAWAVVAHSSIDIAEFQDAEFAYQNLLALTPDDDESRPAVIDGLAASIYKQAEQANVLEDYRTAASHFLRIKDVAPTSGIRSSAEYDAAAALIKLQDWAASAGVLEEFRSSHPEHELAADATKQLAFIYREDGHVERAAREHERVAIEATDPELKREALLTAGELFDQVDVIEDAIRVYEIYVANYPMPMDIAMQTRSRLAEIFKLRSDYERYYEELGQLVAVDRDAGTERTDRSRYLASQAALVLAERTYKRFADLRLTQPFEESLNEKQTRMDGAIAAFEELVDYEVADVTSAATYYIAETYLNFSVALLESERPDGLSEIEKVDYEMVLEEEAFPFEERAIEIHERNLELLSAGVYNSWVQQSLDELAALMPGRYAKNESSEGHLKSIDSYAYRMPIVPEVATSQLPSTASPDGMVTSQGAQ